MLDDIIEILLELVLEGMAEAAGSKRVPMPVRVALVAVIALVVLGLFGLLLYVGICSGSVLLIVLSALLMAAVVIWAVFKVRAFKARK